MTSSSSVGSALWLGPANGLTDVAIENVDIGLVPPPIGGGGAKPPWEPAANEPGPVPMGFMNGIIGMPYIEPVFWKGMGGIIGGWLCP